MKVKITKERQTFAIAPACVLHSTQDDSIRNSRCAPMVTYIHMSTAMVTPGWLKALPTWNTTGRSQSVPSVIGTLICITPGTVPCVIGNGCPP